jgi:hypothetical protein
VPPFSFTEWYARKGYHRHGGQKACAEALGITTRHVQMLLRNERVPGATLIKLCQAVQLLDACQTTS